VDSDDHSGEGAGNLATTGRDIANLLAIMARLRDPETGCAWDVAQNFATIAPYTIEEAHEVADAIQRNDMDDLCEELGDLLLQVVFHARIAEEAGAFTFADVVEAITAKMVRRHPHVFGDSPDRSPEAIGAAWQRIKAGEKAARRARRAAVGADDESGLLSDVPAGLPPLSRALKLQQRAATVGFDWPDAAQVMDKVDEEINEIKHELEIIFASRSQPDRSSRARAGLSSEIGDALFALVNLARHTNIDPEQALAGTNHKFVRRFSYIEKSVHTSGKQLADASLEEMEGYWRDAKKQRQETDA